MFRHLVWQDWAIALIPVLLAVLGVYVSLSPPTTHRGRRSWVSAFAVVGLALAIGSLWQINVSRTEAATDKQALGGQLQSLQKQLGDLSPVPKSIDELREKLETSVPVKAKAYADLGIQFAGTDRLLFQLYNSSRTETAIDPKYGFIVWNYSRKNPSAEDPNAKNPLPIPWKLLARDFIHPNRAMGPWELLEIGGARVKQMVENGDQLFGYANVSCVNCSGHRTYYVYFRVGQGGWYVPKTEKGSVSVPVPHRDYNDPLELEKVLTKMFPSHTRIAIPSRFT